MSDNGFATAPFLKIILPAAAGLCLAQFADIPVWVSLSCALTATIMVIIMRGRPFSSVYTWSAVFFFFLFITTIGKPRTSLPLGERIIATAQIRENPYRSGRWQMTTADIGYFRLAGKSGSAEASEWVKVSERITLAVDTSYHDILPGLQIAFRGWINPMDTTGSSYGNLMRLRGLHGRMYLVPGNLLYRSAHLSRTPAYYASRLQAAAISKLGRLDLDENATGIVAAMTAGDKRGIGRQLRSHYSATGAAHLLAVSGLHVGIVFVLINALLYFIPAARYGHIWKSVAAVAAIWLYAAMAGLAPSVVRAALMFTFAQAAFATTSYRNSLNVILGSAVVMLALNPNYAGDPSFLLSYAAVLSIVAFFNPVFKIVRTRYKLLNALLSVLIVGFAATVGTAPLVAYWFGNFPLAGLLINPAVIFTAHIIVMAGVLWILMPFGWLEPVFSWVLSAATWLQNGLVEWSASLRWSSFAVSLPLWGVVAAYAVIIGGAVALHRFGKRRKKSLSLPL